MSLYDFSSRSWLPKTFDAQGHRGARGLKPENTLPAFEAALDLGVDTLEMDLHLTRDGVVVVWHDPVLDPAKCDVDKNTSAETRLLSSHTLQQLQTYTFDRNPGVHDSTPGVRPAAKPGTDDRCNSSQW